MQEEPASARFDPAHRVITALGGITAAARILHVEPSTVLRWSMSRAAGGSGGVIPPRRWDDVIRAAKLRGHRFTKDDLAGPGVLIARPVQTLLDFVQ